MYLTFNVEQLLLPVSGALQDVLRDFAFQQGKFTVETKALTFNFRDSQYSAKRGGWHPVEIRIQQESGLWHFSYITDFSYQGYPDAELAKEVDFDFTHGITTVLYGKPSPIGDADVMDFYQLWESNFLVYVSMGAFDEIKVTVENQ
jgi:hypothetical protein